MIYKNRFPEDPRYFSWLFKAYVQRLRTDPNGPPFNERLNSKQPSVYFWVLQQEVNKLKKQPELPL